MGLGLGFGVCGLQAFGDLSCGVLTCEAGMNQ